MPAQRPRASFDPIPPDFDVTALVENTPHFEFVDRITADMIDKQGIEAFERLVRLHVIIGGKPLVVEGYEARLDPWTFSSKWLQDNHGDKVENARNLTSQTDLPLTLRHYLKNMKLLTNQYFENPDNYKDKKRQRIYLKDIDCPEVWESKLRDILPQSVFYLNECTGVLGGAGSVDEVPPGGGSKRKGRGIASAGDLMSSLPPPMRAENLMCYIGHEGTYTPAHREMCASLGHNIMVEASEVVGDDGIPEKQGSSLWFMTESSDRQVVAEYWLSMLGHDIEVERHFAQIAAWKSAPFKTYVVEQRPGDFILIPPLAPHQVWNRGTRTIKVAWNRTTVETLELAMNEALPNARLVCRDEQYKNKSIVYYTLQKYSTLLSKVRDQQQTAASPQEAADLKQSPKIGRLVRDFKRLFLLFRDILLSEMFPPDSSNNPKLEFLAYDGNVTCAYCRGNIFNRFLSCSSCENALGTTEPEPYDVCMDCYAMGRSCGCISKLKWVEQFKWKELIQKYEIWRRQYLEHEREVTPQSPQAIKDEYRRLTKKTLAQICQEQLKRRPWVDINKESSEEEDSDDNEEIEMNDDGTVKKPKKRRSETWLKNHHTCHVCCHRHEKWKMATCKCGRSWCYGALFRAFDLMPRTIMEDLDWKCPHCKNICSVGGCKKDPKQTPYQPTGTLLGHDTKRIADARSTESLVDFSVSNLNWLRESTDVPNPANNQRLARKQQDANNQRDNQPESEDESQLTTGEENAITYSPDVNIDPLLDSGGNIEQTLSQALQGSASRSFTTSNPPANSTTLEGINPLGNISLEHDSIQSFDAPFPGYEPAVQQNNNYFERTSATFPDQEWNGDHGTRYPGTFLFEAKQSMNGEPPPHQSQANGLNGVDGIILTPSKKRKRKPGERMIGLERKAISGATQQYRKEQEKKQLEEARKNGVFIMTNAVLKGKSRIIKLPLNRQILEDYVNLDRHKELNREVTNSQPPVEPEADATVILQSDVLQASELPDLPVTEPGPRQPTTKTTSKAANAVRVRVEPDEDFYVRKRDRKSGANTSGTAQVGYEELDLDSDSSGEDLENYSNNNNAKASANGSKLDKTTSTKRRRISQWQAQKHRQDGEDQIIAGLPNDWKDGNVTASRRERTSNSAKNSKRAVSINGMDRSSPMSVNDKGRKLNSKDSINFRGKGYSSSSENGGPNVSRREQNKDDQNADEEQVVEDEEENDVIMVKAVASERGRFANDHWSSRPVSASPRPQAAAAAAARPPGSRPGGPGARKFKIVSGAAKRRAIAAAAVSASELS